MIPVEGAFAAVDPQATQDAASRRELAAWEPGDDSAFEAAEAAEMREGLRDHLRAVE
jgi:hypothetical protein